jgi:RNA polymerase sigma-70 factor (ECF subfamily)
VYRGVKGDDPVADDELVMFCRAQYPRLVGLLGLYCGDRAVAEELAQETLARVWRKWPKVHHLDRPEAWAQRVAINLAKSHVRRLVAERKARRRTGPVAEEVPHAMVEEVAMLRGALTKLPHRQRTAVVLHYYADLSLEEIAERMGASIPSVKSLLHRAVKRLRSEENVRDLLEVPDVN